jgi:subtilisin family serine protease
MSHQCPFPVQSTDNRCGYRAGSAPGFTLSLALVAALGGYAGLSHAAPANKPANASSTPVTSDSIVGWAKGRLLVAPRAGLSDKELEKALKSQGAKSKGRFKQANIHIIELPPGADEVAAMRALRKDKRFKYVELDLAMAPAASVNDPNVANSWPLPKIQANTAWDTSNGSGVIIAILDSGLDANHPDLRANYIPGWNFYDNNSDTTDNRGHGTAVAGTAAMVANNSTGSAGVAYGARIMPIRISSPDGIAYGSTMAQALYWAADNGAKVANISFSGVPGNSTVQSAAQYMRSKGGYVVASAGNSGVLENVAAEGSILAVSATDQNDARPSWSSYGPYVDVSAPGVSVYSTTVGGGFGNYSGTSFSSPIVAATAALALAANSRLTPADIDRILTSTATDLGTAGYDQYFGHGRVDAARAVAAARAYVASDTQAPTISITSPTGGKVASVVPVDVRYSDNVGATRAELFVNGSKVATDDVGPFAFAWDTSTYGDGTYTLVAKAYDAAGNVGSSPSVSVSIGNDSTAPTLSSFNLTAGMTISPTKQTVSVSATDNQSVAKISLLIDGKEVAVAYGGSLSYSWNTRKLAKGPHTVTVRITDNSGLVTSTTVTVYR